MANFKKAIWQIFVVSVWINIFETLRWVLFAKPDIDMHFKAANLVDQCQLFFPISDN